MGNRRASPLYYAALSPSYKTLRDHWQKGEAMIPISKQVPVVNELWEIMGYVNPTATALDVMRVHDLSAPHGVVKKRRSDDTVVWKALTYVEWWGLLSADISGGDINKSVKRLREKVGLHRPARQRHSI